MKRIFATLCLAFTLALVALRPVGAAPALWQLSDADTKIYFFGTLHVLEADMPWLSHRATKAFTGADALIVELDGPELDKAGTLFTKAGTLPKGQSLRMIIGNGIYNDISRLSRTLGIPQDHFADKRPWFAGMSLSVIGLVKAGFDPASGADKYFIAQAEGMEKPVLGIETAAQQAALFAGLTLDQEKALLVDTLQQAPDIKRHFAEMQSAWLAGDTAALDRLINDALDKSPGLAERLLYTRNRGWADKMVLLLNKPGQFFVAVGAGHLAGTHSLQAVLETQGLSVSRVE